MKKHLSIIIFFLAIPFISFNQSQKVFTQDIENFWIAYDSVKSTPDSLQQIHYINKHYIDKGSEGLKTFMMARNYSAGLWVSLINKYPKFWNSIRPNTLTLKSKALEIEKSIEKFRIIYPALKEAKMYFTIGGLRSGGTTSGNMVLIGAEIATGNPSTDVSEFPDKWLEGVFKEQSLENIITLNIHEYVHTQQKGQSRDLLAQSIREGSCDFITELVLGQPIQTNYINYGKKHEARLKQEFKEDMFTSAFNRWLYNGANAETVADLGYFMGYAICQAYYKNQADKRKAIRDIIELDYADSNAVEGFLKKSKYYKEPLEKEKLLKSFREKQPVFLKMEPFGQGDSLVNADLAELSIVFSKPMGTGISINKIPSDTFSYPITGVAGFSEDRRTLTLKIKLSPGTEYGFIITSRGFRSADGYPLLKDYRVNFKTRP